MHFVHVSRGGRLRCGDGEVDWNHVEEKWGVDVEQQAEDPGWWQGQYYADVVEDWPDVSICPDREHVVGVLNRFGQS